MKLVSFLRSTGLMAVLAGGLVVSGWNQAWAESPRTPPVGFDQLVVYIADGEYDPLSPHPDPEITGCDPSNLCDGEYYQKQILGRTDEEIAAKEAMAKAYFRDRFGMDVDDPNNAGRLFFRNFYVDPRLNYHVVSFSGAKVPSEGWKVHDGGWIIAVIDPNGFDLGGEYAGEHAPVGTMVVFGDYQFDATRGQGNNAGDVPAEQAANSKSVVIHYESIDPLLVVDNVLTFQCKLESEEYGSGLVRGRGEIIPLETGNIKLNVASILTFPGLSDIPAAE